MGHRAIGHEKDRAGLTCGGGGHVLLDLSLSISLACSLALYRLPSLALSPCIVCSPLLSVSLAFCLPRSLSLAFACSLLLSVSLALCLSRSLSLLLSVDCSFSITLVLFSRISYIFRRRQPRFSFFFVSLLLSWPCSAP